MKSPGGSLFIEHTARAVLLLFFVSAVGGFSLTPTRSAPTTSTTRPPPFAKCTDRVTENIFRRMHPLGMGKGLNSAKSKQLELAKKMALAKKQQQPENTDPMQQMEEAASLSAEEEEEKRLQEDRARFAELLRTAKVSNPNPLYEDDELGTFGQQSKSATMQPSPSITARVGALKAKRKVGSKTNGTNAKKRRKKVNAKNAQVEDEDEEDRPLQEGDIASRYDFDRLTSCETGAALGPMLSAQLVPWVPPFTADYLIILADPRAQSSDLRRAVQYISSNTSPDVRRQVIAISVDEVSITKSWIDRTAPQASDGDDGDGTLLSMFSDRDWEWMRRYSAVDDHRWSMSMITIDNNAVIRKVERDVDPSHVCERLAQAIESIQ